MQMKKDKNERFEDKIVVSIKTILWSKILEWRKSVEKVMWLKEKSFGARGRRLRVPMRTDCDMDGTIEAKIVVVKRTTFWLHRWTCRWTHYKDNIDHK